MRILAALPVDDWQFWVVTVLAAGAAFVVARMVLPPGFLPKRLRRRKGEKRATLTVGGAAPGARAGPKPEK